MLTQQHVQELKEGKRIFEDFVDDGIVEYLDVNEMNDALIAVYENEIGPETTHLEVYPVSYKFFNNLFRLNRSPFSESALASFRTHITISLLVTLISAPWVSRQWEPSLTTSKRESTPSCICCVTHKDLL